MPILTFKNVMHGHDESVRITNDDLLNTVDLVMAVTGNDAKYSAKMIRTITDEGLFDDDKIVERRTPGKENSKTKFVSFSDAIELIMVLPGRTAKQIRVKFADVIVRYLDGDRSMCTEIEENHAVGKSESYYKFTKNVLASIEDENHAMGISENYSFVYAVKSPAFPGLIKIGRTQDIVSRLSNLNTACAPAPFVIVALASSLDHARDEKDAHAFFGSARKEGEFFELADSQVIDYFATSITARFRQEMDSAFATDDNA